MPHTDRYGKNSRLAPALDFIRDNPSAMPTLQQMAELCQLSLSYFSRLFHKEMGISFIHYVNKHKVYLAKARLEMKDKIAISELSKELGFTDASYFIRIFRQHTGITPHAYRKCLD